MSVRAVFDCMVFLQAIANPSGPAMACFGRIEQVGGALLISHDVLAELGDVLTRPELQRHFKRLTPQRVAEFLDQIRIKAVLIDPVPEAFALPRDRKDEPYVNLAIAGDAGYLVTRNTRHLTYLMHSTAPEAMEFRSRYPQLTILDPVEFLRISIAVE